MRSDPDGARVGFDPIGLKVAPGTTVRWVVEANVHTTTAYHPDNDRHPLRIPEGAKPWDSDYLVDPGQSVRGDAHRRGRLRLLLRPARDGRHGRPHHRRPARRPGRPAVDDAAYARQGWRTIPPAAKAAFPSIDVIMSKGIVRG